MPVLDEIRTWLMTQRALPRSAALGKAIAYTSGLWPGLVRFLADPKIPLDTNAVERALRGVAVGRKNHYGSRSERGSASSHPRSGQRHATPRSQVAEANGGVGEQRCPPRDRGATVVEPLS